MSISFTCASCDQPYNVSESFAGKKARCKGCGVEFRVPTPTPPVAKPVAKPKMTSPPAVRPKPPSQTSSDRYGLNEVAAPRPRYDDEDEVVLPRRAPATWTPSERSSRPRGDGGEAANLFCYGGFWVLVGGMVILTLIAFGQFRENGGRAVLVTTVPVAICCGICVLGSLGMFLGFLVAIINFFRFQELPSVGIGGACVWFLAIFLGPIATFNSIRGGVNGWNTAKARQEGQGAVPGQAGPVDPAPAARTVLPGRVVLFGGQITRRQSTNGQPFATGEYRVSYRLGTKLADGEMYVLTIKSGESTMQSRTNSAQSPGSFSGQIPVMSNDDDTPYEAWMDIESADGQNNRRVSETISLRIVNGPAAQPRNNTATPPNGLGQPPINRPGMPPGFPGPRPGRGPRGFPGRP